MRSSQAQCKLISERGYTFPFQKYDFQSIYHSIKPKTENFSTSFLKLMKNIKSLEFELKRWESNSLKSPNSKNKPTSKSKIFRETSNFKTKNQNFLTGSLRAYLSALRGTAPGCCRLGSTHLVNWSKASSMLYMFFN